MKEITFNIKRRHNKNICFMYKNTAKYQWLRLDPEPNPTPFFAPTYSSKSGSALNIEIHNLSKIELCLKFYNFYNELAIMQFLYCNLIYKKNYLLGRIRIPAFYRGSYPDKGFLDLWIRIRNPGCKSALQHWSKVHCLD